MSMIGYDRMHTLMVYISIHVQVAASRAPTLPLLARARRGMGAWWQDSMTARTVTVRQRLYAHVHTRAFLFAARVL